MKLGALVANLLAGFTAGDPGLIRLEQSVKAALAIMSAGLIAYAATAVLADRRMPDAPFFGAVSCFASFLLMTQGPAAARKRACLVGILPYTAGVALSALLSDLTPLRYLTLLGLMFLAFYARRFGAGPAGLIMIATFGFYLAVALSVELDALGWFEVAAVIGFLSTFVWQFLLWPYRPSRYLHRAITAFERKVAATVAALTDELVAEAGAGGERTASVERRLGDVARTRRVVEEQITAAVSTDNWTPQGLEQLRLRLYEIEQGLERMALGAAALTSLSLREPEPLHTALLEVFAALRWALSPGPGRTSSLPIVELAARRDALVAAARSTTDSDASDGWRLPVLQLAAGGLEVGRAVQAVHALQPDAGAGVAPSRASEPAPAGAGPLVPVLGRFRLPATTVLAWQALLSAGLAMLLSTALGLDHPWWAFWTAYIVIAGASGESRRKLSMRVAGTLLGVTFGTLVAVLAPDSVAVVLTLIAAGMAMAIYMRPVSYTWMVFWIAVFLAVLFGAEGDARTILIQRPTNVAIGAVIAALVVTFVLPIPLAARFRAALGRFLAATDRYIATVIGAAGSGTESPALGEAQMSASESYEALAQTFPSAGFDYNPFSAAQSPLTAQQTIVVALHRDTNRLADDVSVDAAALDAPTAGLVAALQARVHAEITVTLETLSDQAAAPARSATRTLPDANALLRVDGHETEDALPLVARRVIDDLTRIHLSLRRLAEELGGRIEPPQPQTVMATGPATSDVWKGGAAERR